MSRFSALQRAENSSNSTKECGRIVLLRFSALQRAENSSKQIVKQIPILPRVFQCSSASRKFLKRARLAAAVR